MGEIKTQADDVYRDFSTAGLPSSEPQEPEKADIRGLFGTIDTSVEALKAGQVAGGGVAFELWTLLAAHPFTEDGTPGSVYDDPGTHVDPITGATVANTGLYRSVTGTPSGWKRIEDDVWTGKADKSTTVTGAGLATGGGDLSANRTITVPPATFADVQAGAPGLVAGADILKIALDDVRDGVAGVVDERGTFEVAPYTEITHVLADELGFAVAAFYGDGRVQTAIMDVSADSLLLPKFGVEEAPDLSTTVYPAIGTVVSIRDELGFEMPLLRDFFPDGGSASFDYTPLFSGTLCGAQGVTLSLYPRQIFASRDFPDDDTMVTLGSWSDSGIYPFAGSGRDEIQFRTDQLGDGARLVVRPKVEANTIRHVREMDVFTAPVYSAGAGPAKNILVLGDSITHLQGPYLLKYFLEQMGYVPTMVGTKPDANNVPGECRVGSSTAMHTYLTTQTVLDPNTAGLTGWSYLQPVAIGAEAAYLALTADERAAYNPFIRPAEGSDDPAIIRNGYVLDFAQYCTRFSVPTPDVVPTEFGTNDGWLIHDGAGGGAAGLQAVYDYVYAEEKLLLSRMIAAWPDVRLIRYLSNYPRNTAIDEGRWAYHVQIIKAMHAVKSDLAHPHHVIAPAWGMINTEVGNVLTVQSTDAVLGAFQGTIADYQHPARSMRQQLYQVVAGYAACAMANLF